MKFDQFARYIVSGTLTFAVYIVMYILFSNILMIPYGFAALVAYSVSLVVNYFAQSMFTFSYKGSGTRSAMRYALLLLANGALNVSAMQFLPGMLAIPHEIIQLTVLTAIVLINYFGQKFWVFKS